MSRRLLVALALVAVFVLAGGSALAWVALSPNTPSFDGTRSIKVRKGSDFDTYVDSLGAAGLLRRPRTFRLLARLTGWDEQLKSGHYAFASGASNVDLLNTIRRGLQTPVRITLKNGTRPDHMARALSKEMAFSAAEFEAAIGNEELARSLGTDTTHLFGYMLPDTYEFYWETPADAFVRKVKESFDAFYVQAAGSAPGPFVALSPADVTSIASIVEWETAHQPEMARVAGVYLNRLRDRWLLQADPTIQYALIRLEGSKRRLLFRDYRLDHPYNTYVHAGLPPGPVTNPSKESIRAVLNPERHGFYFFVATGDGSHIFSRTLAEHSRNAQAFYRVMRERRAAAAREAAAAGQTDG